MGIFGTLLIIVHLIVCFGLVVIVLLQAGKGASLAGVFGASGGSDDTLFGSSGPGSGIRKMTVVFGITFMITALALAYMSSHRTTSVFEGVKTAPVSTEPATEETAAPAAGEVTTEGGAVNVVTTESGAPVAGAATAEPAATPGTNK